MTDLGTVERTVFGHPVRATFRDDGTWVIACDDAEARGFVEMVAGEIATRRHGPEHGPYGPRQLRLLAEVLGGTVVDQARPESVPGTIY